jgi:ABC-2 type transport system ATP-binding protein
MQNEATDLAIDARDLVKRYGERIVAVNGLTLRIRKGEVYGFLGPNGAGKTTTLRMILGLIRPTSGEVTVLGEAPSTATGLRRIGAMIEGPAFYPFLSGRDNLRVMARYAGVSEDRIEPVLAEVELAGRGHDTFSTYSQGMKQRLGVAAALLKDPQLLILDEPTNGLDPAGMAEMRTLIRGLAKGGRTVLLSSHLMTEVEQICDRVGIVRKGRLVAEGTVEDLRAEDALRVRVEPLDEARRVILEMNGVGEVTVQNGSLRIATDPARSAAINRALVNAGLTVSEVCVERSSLEDVFLDLTQEREVAT